MKKHIAKILIAALIGANLILGGTNVKADTLPPTSISQSELSQLQNMTLEQLQKVAKPMPEGHYQVLQGVKRENYYSPIPEDGQIYYLENDLFGIKDVVFYKFLYINPSPSEPGIVQYNIFTWESVNDVLDTKSSVKLVGNEGNQDLYDKLTGRSASSPSDTSGNTSAGQSNPPTNSDTNSNNGNGSNTNSSGAKHYKSKRLSGLNRIDTAEKIAEEIYSGTVQNVVLATGNDFPDALSGSVLANKLNAPILLTGTNADDTRSTIDYIKNHLDKSGTIYFLGGQGAISNTFVDTFNSLGYNNIVRIGGSNRFSTCNLINSKLDTAPGTPIVIATGNDYPDALSISSIAAAKGYPIILTDKDSLSADTTSLIQSIKPSKIYIAGGTGVVSENVLSQVKALTSLTSDSIIRLAGNDRYETSLNIAKYFNLTGDTVTFATGNNFPDALAGSVLAAKHNAPIILVGDDVSNQVKYINGQNFTNEIIFGGTGAVSSSIESTLTN